MGPEHVTFLTTFAVVGAAMGALALFGLFRHRGNDLVWTSAAGSGGVSAPVDAGPAHDPEIARRMAALLRDEALAPPAPPVADEPGPDEGTDADLFRFRPDAFSAESVADPPQPSVPEPGYEAAAVPFDPDETLRRLLVDPVTGLGSRLAWDRWLEDEEARERRYRRPTTLVVVEVAGLDAVAAFSGPDAAVRIVVAIAGIVGTNVRSSDHAALVGPARFAILLPETDEVRAVNFVERVRASCDAWLDENAPTVGVGFGWASPGASTGLTAARALADRRLAEDVREAAKDRLRD